jgi:hypothetical protein
MLLNDPLFLIAGAAVLVVLVILMIGIGSFARGGEFNLKNSNRFMRWRLYAQLVAVILIVGFVYIRQHWGN